MFKVQIIESEAGWGRKLDSEKEFETEEEARQFCKDYNNKYNPEGPVPEWYMYARMENQKEYGMLR